jgi:hypothetical protein
MRTLDGVRMTSFRFSGRYVRSVRPCTHAHAAATLQTETYQVPGGDGPTHGTDGPLNVALAKDGLLADCNEQFLQVARAFDPARAREPLDTDTNDLSTINVYTVGVLPLPPILVLHLMCLLRASEMAQVRTQIPLPRWAWLG